MKTERIKKRNPFLVILFSFITGGIYLIYWLIQTTKELKSNTPSAPTLFSLYFIYFILFLTMTYMVIGSYLNINLGVVIVIFILCWMTLFICGTIFFWKYSKAIEELTGFSAIGLFLLWIFMNLVAVIVAQIQLNKKTNLEIKS